MEILFRRFGKELLESKVNEFMSQDEDGDNDITFTEFLHMDMRSDKEGTPKHPGLLVSQGVVKTTREENGRLLQAVQEAKRSNRLPTGAIRTLWRTSPRIRHRGARFCDRTGTSL